MPTKLTDIVKDLSQRVRLFENVTGYLGGGSTNIDGVATVSLTAGGASSGGIFCPAVIGSAVHIFRLRTGTDAENSPAIIRPDDFNSGTNAKVWELEGAVLGNTTMIGTLTLAADPSSALQAATKQYVDLVAVGITDAKQSVRAATTANITLSGAQTIDGVSVIAGDRVLVKDQSSGANNGIYVAASGAWARATDADSSAEVTAGMYCYVTEGTANGDSGWLLTTNDPITLGTTALTFVQFTGAGQITAGNGIVKSGNTLHVAQSGSYTAGAIIFASSSSGLGFDASNFFWNSTSHRLGLLTNAPTHTLTLGTPGQIALYGTSDQTTNYSRLLVFASLDTYVIEAIAAGTANAPDMLLAAVDTSGHESRFQILPSLDGPAFRFLNLTANTTAAVWMDMVPLLGGSSGTRVAVSLTPTITQSSTAGYTAVLVNVTETSTGSGSKVLLDLQVGGSSKFTVTNAGAATLVGAFTVKQIIFSPSTLTYAGTTAIDFDSDAFKTISLTGNITFTTSNRASGKSITLKILCDSSSRNFTFPSWIFVGAAAPASIAANKTAILSLTCFGSNDTDIVAAYAEQP